MSRMTLLMTEIMTLMVGKILTLTRFQWWSQNLCHIAWMVIILLKMLSRVTVIQVSGTTLVVEVMTLVTGTVLMSTILLRTSSSRAPR